MLSRQHDAVPCVTAFILNQYITVHCLRASSSSHWGHASDAIALSCGNVQVRDFFQRVQLSPIDTYFMIDCVNGGKVPGPIDPSSEHPSGLEPSTSLPSPETPPEAT